MKMIRPIVILLAVLATGAAHAGVVVSGYTDVRYNSCSLCDSYLNWAVWKTEGTSWYDDSFFGGSIQSKIVSDNGMGNPAGVITGTERYVYMYQVVNEDQLAALEARIEELDVNDPWNCFTGVGWFQGMTFEDAGGVAIEGVPGNGNYTMAATDPTKYWAEGDFPDSSTATAGGSIKSEGRPAAGSASGLADIPTDGHISTGLVASANVVDPSSGQIAQPWTSLGAFPGTQVTTGSLWRWDTPNILPLDASSVVFAVSDRAPVYRPANTKGQGGPGAAGDAPSPCVPEPSSWLIGMGLALAYGGVAWRRRRRLHRQAEA